MLRCSTEEAIAFLSRYVGNEYYTPQCQEAHRMAIAALREQEKRRWIPVTERLPETGECVLVYRGPDTLMNVDYMLEPGLWGADPYYDDEMIVTHWMPLPEPPKGD